MNQTDKWGGRPKSVNQITNFRAFVDNSALMELTSESTKFTWSNRRSGPQLIRERLDHCFCTANWREYFTNASILFEPAIGSDHSPLVLLFQPPMPHGKKLFKFDAHWQMQEGCREIIKNGWEPYVAGSPLQHVASNLKRIRQALSIWAKNHKLDDIQEEVQRSTVTLQQAQQSPWSPEFDENLKRASEMADNAIQSEALYWHQRSKIHWLQSGDRNTKFFHATTLQHRTQNRLLRLKSLAGPMLEDEFEIDEEVRSYFQSLYQSDGCGMLEEALQFLNPVFSNEMNQALCHPITDAEIHKALFSMRPLKAPGPDGYSPIFFQQNWDIIGVDICRAMNEFFSKRWFPPELNHTHIVLLPKRNDAETVEQYRPLSLCNVLYRVFAKVLSTRLAAVLDDIIALEQNAFIAGRSISDNVLMAQELGHHIKQLRSGRTYKCAVKIDLKKAYDRIQWEFLEALLRKMGLCEHWIQLLLQCVTTVSFSLKINGVEKPGFQPQRGLRQGDPLSPALFVLCTQCLHTLIQGAADSGMIRGITVRRQSPTISHSFFADDVMLFLHAKRRTFQQLKLIFEVYCVASGEAVNFQKSSISFSPNTPNRLRHLYASSVGIANISGIDRYLGLPATVDRRKVDTFQNIKDKTLNRLAAWKSSLLSPAGREVLIKSIATAIPMYAMSHFLLPATLIHDIMSAMAQFYWGQKRDERKIHWVSLETLCLPKMMGGLGVKDLMLQNVALLAKIGWRLLQNSHALWARLLQSIYYPNSRFMDANIGSNPSWVWRSVIKGSELLKQGLLWRVGNGLSIRIWDDPWVPSLQQYKIQTPRPPDCNLNLVASLFHQPGCWDISKVRRMFSSQEAEAILSIPLSTEGCADQISWAPHPRGVFTVKSAYRVEVANKVVSSSSAQKAISTSPSVWKLIWSSMLPPVVKTFLWKACLQAIAVASQLLGRNVLTSDICPCCHGGIESVEHALFQCPQSQLAWLASPMGFKPDGFPTRSISEWLIAWDSVPDMNKQERKVWFAKHGYYCWEIWKRRNECCFATTVTPFRIWLEAATGRMNLMLNVLTSKTTVPFSKTDVPPPQLPTTQPSTFKLFSDAGKAGSHSHFGLGYIMVDTSNSAYALGVDQCRSSSPLIAESLAMRMGLIHARQAGLLEVVVHSDCEVLVHSILGDLNPPPAEIATVVSDIRAIALYFSFVQFVHIKRDLNVPAHSLAAWACEFPGPGKWVLDFPEDVLQFVNMFESSSVE